MSSLICVVCLDDLQTKSAMSTTCGHIFCSECAASQFVTRPSCPVCRTAQTFEQLIRLFPEYGTPAPDPPNPASTATTATTHEIPEPEAISFRLSQQLRTRQLLLSLPQSPRTPLLGLRVQPPASRRPLIQMLQPRTQPRLQALAHQLEVPQFQRSVQRQHVQIHIQTPQLRMSTAGSGRGISYVCQSQSSVVTIQVQRNGAGQDNGAVRRP